MIKNERQYRDTRALAKRFIATVEQLELDQKTSGYDPLRQIQIDASKSQLRTFEHELQEFESAKRGEFDLDQLETVPQIPRMLIQARIALGLTQKDLAEIVGLKEQQIQKYEATDYAQASLTRLNEIAFMLRTHKARSVPEPAADPPLTGVATPEY